MGSHWNVLSFAHCELHTQVSVTIILIFSLTLVRQDQLFGLIDGSVINCQNWITYASYRNLPIILLKTQRNSRKSRNIKEKVAPAKFVNFEYPYKLRLY